mgnify:CR=1 FL=1
MDNACNLKMQAMHIEQQSHKKQIGLLFRKQQETDQALADIKQIKYILIGAVGFYLLDSIGLIETLKLIVGN